MKVSILCSNREHPIYPYLQGWVTAHRSQHDIELAERSANLKVLGGDILFLMSCHEMISLELRKNYRACLVVHASDLPEGRGWSPLVWQILEGKNVITVTLLEAAEPVDSGAIWHKTHIRFEGHELYDEIHAALFGAELALMDFALQNLERIMPIPQQGEASYYPRRHPKDSRLDVHLSIAEQFELLRVADNERYPAFFDHRGHRYQIILRKDDGHAQ
jgi:methionyl-tRNA formyltransferase